MPITKSGAKILKNTYFCFQNQKVQYNLQLPDNKSIRIRHMIWAWVRDGVLSPISTSDCRDIAITHRALDTLSHAKVIKPHTSSLPSRHVVDVEDCGAAYRFLMPLLALTPGCWLLTGTQRLLQRPIKPLVAVLQKIGSDIRRTDEGWLIHGKPLASVETINTSSLRIDASLSSQMASALVLAAPLLNLRTLHLTTTDIPSLSYLRMTLACTRDWSLEIPGVAVPDIPTGLPGDWSAALFWFAHACLHPGNIYSLHPLSLESIQGDSIIIQWFSELGLSISTDNLNVVVEAGNLHRHPKLEIDVRDNLDTVPVMAALATLLPADITFLNVRNLQYKESDRLKALTSQLRPYADVELSENKLRVAGHGNQETDHPHFDTQHDHRLAMAFLLFPNAVLNDTDCLVKSYPGLLGQLQ